MIVKDKKEKEILKEAGRRLATVLHETADLVHPGVSTEVLNRKAEEVIGMFGDKSAFLNYQPIGAPKPYPATLCIAVNDTVVHGIPNEDPIVLKEGDIIGLDSGLVHKGIVVDSGITVPVGEIDNAAKKLLNVTKEALHIGIKAARVGNRVGDIGYAIESFVKPYGYGIVRELCGHGVGRAVHEEPNVPNYGRPNEGPELLEGMVLAIEPMLNEKSEKVIFDRNDYTVRTRDSGRSAHFEHTILITKKGPEIITKK
ncbi:MAG: type I methionyl aminopeptidase [Candidatus Pacebacteria bacterium]|jgi:methionyl aminopeptidase|nr:type I methionyl aminopeptidase [bacterium]MDP6527291.1 type I methionyl aminopeptidase [Candidatus Paceibacterota bacterium]MDP6659431.1 type I methionyl aminopeptidase [Candidatus Paceibacterota bacterium]|tara:strand:- start:9835 stop:10602 length:768 start_codon:yes stop_codon:yes gene_type:complete